MILEERKGMLKGQQYRIIGNHSAIKVCLWCKKAIRGQATCYKHKFYGIQSWRCIQASVTLDSCTQRCNFCWRDLSKTNNDIGGLDEPKNILDGLVKEQKEVLQGFWGSEKSDKTRLNEAMRPRHVALSLTGETCLYEKLPELVDEIHNRNMTSFIVTNGNIPVMIKKLIEHKPTQLYITLPAPTKEIYYKVCNPLIKDSWENLQKSLGLLKEFERGTIRLTLAKGMNMMHPEKYAEILNNINFKFLEIKAAMPVGYARYRMEYKQMPSHEEIKQFANEICKLTNLKIIDEKQDSRVVLISKEDSRNRKLGFAD